MPARHNNLHHQDHQTNHEQGPPESLIMIIKQVLSHIANCWAISPSGHQFLIDIGMRDLLDSLARQIARHPIITFALCTAFMALALPFVLFVLFAVATIMMTFTAFLIVEGTLITLASLLLFAAVGCVLVTGAFVGSATMAGYLACTYACEALHQRSTDGGQQPRMRARNGGN